MALLPHSEKAPGLNPLVSQSVSACMFSLGMKKTNMFVRLTADCQVWIGVCGFLCLCVCSVMDSPVQAVLQFLPSVIWDRHLRRHRPTLGK